MVTSGVCAPSTYCPGLCALSNIWSHLVYVHWPTYCHVLCALINVLSCPACTSQRMMVTSGVCAPSTYCPGLCALANIWSHLVYVHWPTYCPVLCALINVLSCPACTSQRMMVTSGVCALANILSWLVCTSQCNVLSCVHWPTWSHLVYVHWPTYSPVLGELDNGMSCPVCTSQCNVLSCVD